MAALLISVRNPVASGIAIGAVALFGFLAAKLAWRLRFGRDEMTTLSSEGLWDRHPGPNLISWGNVQNVQIRGAKPADVMLKLTEAGFARLRPGRLGRF